MSKLGRNLLILLVLGGVLFYLAAPFWTAYQIREAIKNADVATLEAKVDWPSVRQSLRQSLASNADLLPASLETEKPSGPIRTAILKRLRNTVGNTLLDHFVDRYITAEGLPRLYRMQNNLRRNARRNTNTAPNSEEQETSPLYERLKHVSFTSLSSIELGVASRTMEDRHIVLTLERFGLEWKLTRIIIAPAS